MFALYGVALDSHDADCPALGEALACAADRLTGHPLAPLLTALSATIEASMNRPDSNTKPLPSAPGILPAA
ncbi:hypothetical protein [Azonexus sp.]|jgi:hypothetical protein|uniref:hypothetical protein n=1 Tax=Azonexus sp. TaxID=1872668 RepID=UPI0028307B93|nr:hypothetical protein [Azonexus sp.]MDR1995705.1 hypothetical protein [Azonexus sp.]